MAPTPRRIAQTSTEAKKQHKKAGSRLSDGQQKQLERAVQLDQRAARLREAEDRRRAAKKKREEKEQKEALARKQTGVSLATQLIGYSHTQAQLKNGMEAFLGVKKRKDEEKQRKELDFTKTLDSIAKEVEKGPWGDDKANHIAPNLLEPNTSFGAQWADDDLDDDSLLEAHDSALLDSVSQPVKIERLPSNPNPPAPPPPPEPTSSIRRIDFVRLHGPINKAVEATLEKLPEPLIELLSQDLSMKAPDWDPPLTLLYKLNPVGLPPHRLRLKVGCIVSLLKDLNTSSQLSKSQHLRLICADKDRLECIVLDGQLEGTKTFLTRVAFSAKYKNQDQYPFQRTQFPIRVSTEYIPPSVSRDTSQFTFKLPTAPTHQRGSTSLKRPNRVVRTDSPGDYKPAFKMPHPPASKSSSSVLSKPTVAVNPSIPSFVSITDGWDNFLDSGTQIARELAIETSTVYEVRFKNPINTVLSKAESPPLLSTQDLEFSLDDLDEEVVPQALPANDNTAIKQPKRPETIPSFTKPMAKARPTIRNNVRPKTEPLLDTRRTIIVAPIATEAPQNPINTPISLGSSIHPQPRKPPSVSDRPGLKRKAWKPPQDSSLPQSKRPLVPSSRHSMPVKLQATAKPPKSLSDVPVTTQEAAFLFDDDENMSFGSPLIQV